MTKAETTSWWSLLHALSQSQRSSKTSEQTRNEILDAAFKEIHRVGFQAASLQNILKTTKLTKGALYHHFPNKQALGYALVDEIIRLYIEECWIAPLKTTDDPIAALKNSIINASKKITLEDIKLGCPLNNLAQEMALIDEGFRQHTEHIFQDWRNAIVEALERGKKMAKVKADVNSEQIAILYIAILEGCQMQAKSSQNMDILHNCGRGLINILDNLEEKTP